MAPQAEIHTASRCGHVLPPSGYHDLCASALAHTPYCQPCIWHRAKLSKQRAILNYRALGGVKGERSSGWKRANLGYWIAKRRLDDINRKYLRWEERKRAWEATHGAQPSSLAPPAGYAKTTTRTSSEKRARDPRSDESSVDVPPRSRPGESPTKKTRFDSNVPTRPPAVSIEPAPSNGALPNGASSNGASSNGAPSNGAPSNGAPSNETPLDTPADGAPSDPPSPPSPPSAPSSSTSHDQLSPSRQKLFHAIRSEKSSFQSLKRKSELARLQGILEKKYKVQGHFDSELFAEKLVWRFQRYHLLQRIAMDWGAKESPHRIHVLHVPSPLRIVKSSEDISLEEAKEYADSVETALKQLRATKEQEKKEREIESIYQEIEYLYFVGRKTLESHLEIIDELEEMERLAVEEKEEETADGMDGVEEEWGPSTYDPSAYDPSAYDSSSPSEEDTADGMDGVEEQREDKIAEGMDGVEEQREEETADGMDGVEEPREEENANGMNGAEEEWDPSTYDPSSYDSSSPTGPDGSLENNEQQEDAELVVTSKDDEAALFER